MKSKMVLLIFPVLISCQGSESKKTSNNKPHEQFLNDISLNSKVLINDITEIKRQPSDDINLVTKYPLSKAKKEEYDKNGTLTNDSDISDSSIYKIKSYNLINEKNEKVEIVEDGSSKSLQNFALSDYNKLLYQNLGTKFKLNKKFETFKGSINIEFEISKNDRKEAKVPVNFSIHDKISE